MQSEKSVAALVLEKKISLCSSLLYPRLKILLLNVGWIVDYFKAAVKCDTPIGFNRFH